LKRITRKDIENKLNNLGWTLPQGVAYKGMLYVHAVKCSKCGWVQDKRLDNLIYRKEKCTHCMANKEAKNDILGEVFEDLKNVTTDLITTVIERITTAINNRSSDITQAESSVEFRRLLQKLISKIGFNVYQRKLTSKEWFDLSHNLAEEVMREVAWDKNEFDKWEEQYLDILGEQPNKQGQDILPLVIPLGLHKQVIDKIRIRVIQT
jgi:uncharacterized protein YdiU (UPF0061 family)